MHLLPDVQRSKQRPEVSLVSRLVVHYGRKLFSFLSFFLFLSVLQEEAEVQFGKDQVKVYQTTFTPMYYAVTETKHKCSMKLVCQLPTEKVYVHSLSLYLSVCLSLPLSLSVSHSLSLFLSLCLFLVCTHARTHVLSDTLSSLQAVLEACGSFKKTSVVDWA